MTNIEIVANFEREINKLDDTVNKPATDDSLYWLNQAIAKFCKTRFNGNAPHLTSYEQNEKRTRDLVKLFVEKNCDIPTPIEHTDYDVYEFDYPTQMMYMLNEDVDITDMNNANRTVASVFECTRDSYMHRINNSLTDFHYTRHKARPLRIRIVDGCQLLTDKKYKIQSYKIGYLRTPNKISLENPVVEYTDFNDNVMYEIIKIAAQMYIENQQDKRYETITNEVNTQE